MWATSANRDNYGNQYMDVLYSRTESGYRFHALLDYRFTRLSGTIFVSYGDASGSTTMVSFELDGRVIETHELTNVTRPIPINLSVENINEFRIIVQRPAGVWLHRGPIPHFGDFDFYP